MKRLDPKPFKRPQEYAQKPILTTCGLDHVVLHVRNLEASRAFYRKVLGFSDYFEVPGHCFLRSGDCQVGLFEDAETQSYHELDHVCLRTELLEQDVRQRLNEAKIPLLPRPNGRGWERTNDPGIYIADPDGHVVQILPKKQWPQVVVNPRGHRP